MAASSAPATKQDIQMLMEEIGKLYDTNAQWKQEIIETMDKKISASETKIIHQFRVIAEDMRHDAFGIQKDRIEDHEHRIRRLERHTKLARSA